MALCLPLLLGAGHYRLCKPTDGHLMSSRLSNRGRPCGCGGQRGAARGGGQPGQRFDPQTGLQEHTRYRGLTFQVPSLPMIFLTRQSFTLLYFYFLCSAATYVKVYLLENGVCVAKKKTKVVKKNLDPTYQQALLFDESPQGKVLQVGQASTLGRPNVAHFHPDRSFHTVRKSTLACSFNSVSACVHSSVQRYMKRRNKRVGKLLYLCFPTELKFKTV